MWLGLGTFHRFYHWRCAWDVMLLCRRPRMLTFPMSPQVDFSLERFFTQATREGFVSCVFPEMSDQVWWLTKRFSTDDAFVRFLSWKQKRKVTWINVSSEDYFCQCTHYFIWNILYIKRIQQPMMKLWIWK